MATEVSETLTATGPGNSVSGSGSIDISISGTWTGSVTVQRFLGGAWRDVQAFTTNTEQTMENGRRNPPVRLNVTALSSGSIVTVLSAVL